MLNLKNKIIFFVGAGISKSSGIPTYRDDDHGLWLINDMKEVCVKGKEYDKASYEFYNRFRRMLKDIQPSSVHYFLKEMQENHDCKIYSQNIDDLLERVGCNVEKIHGDACESRCDQCGNIENVGYGVIDEKSVCSVCKYRLRNNIVYYGEQGNYETMISDIIDLEQDDMLFIIGTSNSSINIDAIIKPLKMKKIYVNIRKEERFEMEQYDCVIFDSIENSFDKIRKILNK